jgi:hypothetical protein
MWTAIWIILWPFDLMLRAWLDFQNWLDPSYGKRMFFSEPIRRILESATEIELHYGDLGYDDSLKPAPSGSRSMFTSLGMVRLVSERDRRRVVWSVLQANRECFVGAQCFDAEYVLRFSSELGSAELLICFHCRTVLVNAEVEGGNRIYLISLRPYWLLDGLLQSAGVPKPAPSEFK